MAAADETSPLARALDMALGVQDNDRRRPRSTDVATVLYGLGVDSTTLSATLLSDPRLREGLSVERIREGFGADIAELVRNVHWLNTFKECEHEQLHTPEQAERLRRMLLAMVKDVRAMLIRLAYRLQRLRVLRHERYEARRCVARETLDIYAPLANRLGVAQLKWELEDLAFRYLDPQAYKRIASALDDSRAGREAYVQGFIKVLRQHLGEEGITAQVSGRPKHIHSIWRKMQNKQVPFDELYDLRAVRVIVDRVADCYAVLGVVHGHWQHIPREFDDYIANPKDNSYRSLHTAVVGPGNKVVEVQIRTHEMHAFAERGVAAHWLYKERGRVDPLMQRSIDSLRRMLETGQDGSACLEGFRGELFADRVFVLTPTGEVLDLPRGATPLDFAYAVHTEVGHRCRGAKVNGRIVPLTQVLSSGEQVEILTTKQGRPSRDWLNPNLGYLGTARARAKVRSWFRHQDRERNLRDGRAIVERELRRLGVCDTDLGRLVGRFNLKHEEALFVEVGRGEISVAQLIGAVQLPGLPATALPEARPRTPAPQTGGVTIKGVGNLLTQVARCCKPMSGDPIIGYITQGKGISVHRRDCPNILRLSGDRLQRLVEVEWGNAPRVYPVDVRMEAYDRQGLLRDITAILSNEKVNLLRADTVTDPRDQTVRMALTLEIADTAQLGRVLDRFAQVPNVTEVHRHGP
jgi:GTP pyrophosphokinase